MAPKIQLPPLSLRLTHSMARGLSSPAKRDLPVSATGTFNDLSYAFLLLGTASTANEVVSLMPVPLLDPPQDLFPNIQSTDSQNELEDQDSFLSKSVRGAKNLDFSLYVIRTQVSQGYFFGCSTKLRFLFNRLEGWWRQQSKIPQGNQIYSSSYLHFFSTSETAASQFAEKICDVFSLYSTPIRSAPNFITKDSSDHLIQRKLGTVDPSVDLYIQGLYLWTTERNYPSILFCRKEIVSWWDTNSSSLLPFWAQ